jgi:hypothetical protein
MERRESLDAALREQFADVIGKKITGARMLTPDEFEFYGWDEDFRRPYALEVEGGFTLVVSQDEEGNGPGELFIDSTESFAEQLAEARADL